MTTENTERRAVGDMKAGLTGRHGARVKLSILPRAGMTFAGRAIEYGADKYARGNYHGPPPSQLGEGGTRDPAVMRLLGYVDATMRHLTKIADAVNHALGTRGDARAACAIVDDDGGGAFPPSMLPDLAHAAASLMIGIAGAVDDGLLPADPGRPWDAAPRDELPQKDDPVAERERVLRTDEGIYMRCVADPLPEVSGNMVVTHKDARHKGGKRRRRS